MGLRGPPSHGGAGRVDTHIHTSPPHLSPPFHHQAKLEFLGKRAHLNRTRQVMTEPDVTFESLRGTKVDYRQATQVREVIDPHEWCPEEVYPFGDCLTNNRGHTPMELNGKKGVAMFYHPEGWRYRYPEVIVTGERVAIPTQQPQMSKSTPARPILKDLRVGLGGLGGGMVGDSGHDRRRDCEWLRVVRRRNRRCLRSGEEADRPSLGPSQGCSREAEGIQQCCRQHLELLKPDLLWCKL